MSTELKEKCMQNGTFRKLFDRLTQLTGEKDRKKKVPMPSEIIKEEQIEVHVKSLGLVVDISKPVEKKGVGYTTGTGSVWNVSEYLETKGARNQQIANIVGILKHSLKGENMESMKCLILESSLLPILESALRSCSLLETVKETDLYNAYLDIIQELSQKPELSFTMLEIGDDYVPEQK